MEEQQPVLAALPSPARTLPSTGPAVSFPPSPPSSCGGASPPPPKATHEIAPLAVASKAPSAPPRPAPLRFSIENILRPDFGVPDRTRVCPRPSLTQLSPEPVLRTPPKTPELGRGQTETPVDLSHKKPTVPPQRGPSQPPSEPAPSGTKYPENPEELANPSVPQDEMVWPAWVYCTRYSDRPSSGPRSRRMKRRERNPEEKRPRTAFTSDQLSRLKVEFEENKYLTEKRRQELAKDLGLNESQIKIWFQNKRAKIKKAAGPKNGLAQHLMAQGLYNHSTIPVDEDDPYLN